MCVYVSSYQKHGPWSLRLSVGWRPSLVADVGGLHTQNTSSRHDFQGRRVSWTGPVQVPSGRKTCVFHGPLDEGVGPQKRSAAGVEA